MSVDSRPRPDPLPHVVRFAAALGEPGQPAAGFDALDTALGACLGHRLFTVLVTNVAGNENRRCYSSRPDAYPVGGAKPIDWDGVVTRTVLIDGRCHINRNYDDIKAVFADYELIRSLGCEGSINVPVRWHGTTLGMFALLHEAGWFHEDHMPILSIFAAMTVPLLQHIIAQRPAAAGTEGPGTGDLT
jgi:hypothetical protein